MPHTVSQFISLTGYIALAYVLCRGTVGTLHQLTCWAIRKLGGDDTSAKLLLFRKLVVLAELVSEGNAESDELKMLANEVLAEIGR